MMMREKTQQPNTRISGESKKTAALTKIKSRVGGKKTQPRYKSPPTHTYIAIILIFPVRAKSLNWILMENLFNTRKKGFQPRDFSAGLWLNV